MNTWQCTLNKHTAPGLSAKDRRMTVPKDDLPYCLDAREVSSIEKMRVGEVIVDRVGDTWTRLS